MDDCYLVTHDTEATITNAPTVWVTRLWIGKRDFLLHQVQISISNIKLGERRITQTQEQIAVDRKYTVEDFEPKTSSNGATITLHSAPPATPSVAQRKDLRLPVAGTNDPIITVVSAEFGMGKNKADVTARVAELLRDQPEGFVVNAHTLGADPLPGQKKRLVVKYNYQGTNQVLAIKAGKHLDKHDMVKNALK